MLSSELVNVLTHGSLQESEEEQGEPEILLHLWKADMVTGVLLVDKDNIIIKPNCCVLHPTGGCAACTQAASLLLPVPGRHNPVQATTGPPGTMSMRV